MNKASYLLKSADRARQRADAALALLSARFQEVIDDETAYVLYQPDDGWVLCYGDALSRPAAG